MSKNDFPHLFCGVNLTMNIISIAVFMLRMSGTYRMTVSINTFFGSPTAKLTCATLMPIIN